jgi:hypothetical protein
MIAECGLVICEDWISLDLLETAQTTAGGARVFVWADDNLPTNANWKFRY